MPPHSPSLPMVAGVLAAVAVRATAPAALATPLLVGAAVVTVAGTAVAWWRARGASPATGPEADPAAAEGRTGSPDHGGR